MATLETQYKNYLRDGSGLVKKQGLSYEEWKLELGESLKSALDSIDNEDEEWMNAPMGAPSEEWLNSPVGRLVNDYTTDLKLKPPIEDELQGIGDIYNAIFLSKERLGNIPHFGIYVWSENVFMCNGEKYELSKVALWGMYDAKVLKNE